MLVKGVFFGYAGDMKKLCIRFASLMLGIFMLAGLNGCRKKEAAAPMALDFYAFSLGQADCLLLSYEGYHILIDAGETDDGEDICRALSELGIKKLDLLVVTHFDKDHIGGLPVLAETVEIDGCLMPDYVRDSKKYRAMEAALEQFDVPVMRLQADMGLELGRGSFAFWISPIPYDTEEKNDNELSIVTRFTYGDTSFLLTGDAEGAWLEALCDKSYDISCTVLKVPHHGKWESDLALFTALALPEYAVITDSGKNPADEETLSALTLEGAEILRTAQGDVHLVSDGRQVRIAGE